MMYLEIISPDKVLFAGNVISVRLPGEDGYFELLQDHAPLISLLKEGEIRIIRENGNKEVLQTKKGFAEVTDNTITVLV
ncbi:ATP synthase F1 subunit epsilon [Bacteroidota bacterium]